MAYTKEEIEIVFNEICDEIEQGSSLRAALRKDKRPSSKTFFEWINEDLEKEKQYARATEKRADTIFEDILNIADDNSSDVFYDDEGNERVNNDVIQRAKLRVDARKWMLGKMNPKKYGDKIQQEHSGELTTNIISLGTGIKPDESNN